MENGLVDVQFDHHTEETLKHVMMISHHRLNVIDQYLEHELLQRLSVMLLGVDSLPGYSRGPTRTSWWRRVAILVQFVMKQVLTKAFHR